MLERGARMLMEGLFGEMRPALEGLGQSLSELEPLMGQLSRMIGDIQHYEAPQQLPNGDIILRRKLSAPPAVPLPKLDQPPKAPSADGALEL